MLVTPDYHCGVLESAGTWPHLGFIYIAGELRKAGYEVKIYDAMSKGHHLENIVDHIKEFNPDIVAATAYTATMPAAAEILREAKLWKPSIVTIVGGVHPTFSFTEVLESYPFIDYVIRGEGELTFVDLLETLRKHGELSAVKGIAYREADKVAVTPERDFIEDLDILSPAWDLVEWDDYSFYVYPGSRLAIISTSRGCLHACKFCSQQKFWHQRWRARSPENILREIAYLVHTHKVDVFCFSDEYPTADRQRWEAILDGLIEMDLGAVFLMETRVDDVLRDEDIMEKYRRAGIIHIYVGIEATSQHTLDIFGKGIKESDSKRALDIIHNANIVSETSFVLGGPDETHETIETTLKIAKQYNPDFAHFLLLAPWPYADMYQELKDFVTTKDYSKYNLIEPVIQPKKMTTDELFQEVLRCYREFYFGKIPEWAKLEAGFKRQYAIQSMRAIMENSFLQQHVLSLGKMPKLVRDLMNVLFDEIAVGSEK